MVITVIGIDLGSNNLRIVASKLESGKDNNFEIIGRSYTQKHISSTNAGNIVNIEKVKTHLKDIVGEVELMTGREIVKAFVGISSNLIKGSEVITNTPIQGKHKTVTEEDVNRAIENAKQINLPKEFTSLHIIPFRFIVDNQGIFDNPLGAKGSRLSLEAFSIVCPKIVISNITSVCNSIGIIIAKPIFEPLAGAETSILPYEREAGVLFIDIGYETTQNIIVKGNGIKHLFIQPFASKHITSDLMEVLNISQEDAERLKKGVNLQDKNLESQLDEGVEVKVAGTGTRKIVRKSLIAEVVWARIYEIFQDIKNDLNQKNMENNFPAGVVIAGGGAKISNIEMIAKEVFKKNARVAIPSKIEGLTEDINDPSWVNAVGLLQFGYHYFPEECILKRGLFSRLFKKK